MPFKYMRYVVAIYALLILMGGIMGYTKAGSTASLAMGVCFGVLLLVSAVIMWGKKARLRLKGAYLALILTFLLDAFFSYRYMTLGKFMPSGMLSLVSTVVVLLLALHIRRVK